MRCEWDPAKAEANRKKHGIRFADAVAILSDERALTLNDPHPREERYITLGMDGLARLLVVVYTWRGDVVRLISARKATPAESIQYVEGEL